MTEQRTYPRRQLGSEGAARVSRLEQQLAIAQEITHIGSWEWDLASGHVTWSDELYRIYGLEPQSLTITVNSFLERVHPDDRDAVLAHVRSAVERGGRFEWRERIVRPDGSVRELQTAGDVMRDNGGSVAALIGTCRDVTDERRRDEMIRAYTDIADNVHIGLLVWKVHDPTTHGKPTLVTFNPAAERHVQRSLGTSIGATIDQIFGPPVADEVARLLQEASTERSAREVFEYQFGSGRAASVFTLKAIPLPSGRVGLTVEDTTRRTRAEQQQRGEQQVLEMIAAGAPLSAVLRELVLLIEAQCPDLLGSVLLLDDDGTHVLHGAAPSLPDDYNRAIHGAPIGDAAGSCGTAAKTKRAVFVYDIDCDPLWLPYRELAARHRLRACWSTPIMSKDGRVLGTFACYYRSPHHASAAEISLIDRATYIAGIAIERRQLEDQLRALSARVESVREDERTGIAREIHDELGQALTAVKMDLAVLEERSLRQDCLAHTTVMETVESVRRLTDDMLAQVRRISAQLRPGILDDLGLLAAVEWQTQEFHKRTGIRIHIASNAEDRQFGRQLSTAAFRIFQEALTNVVRHAGARNVQVRLDCEDDRLLLEVEDDGVGIAPEALHSRQSLGLLGIRERARALGGTASIEPGSERGTIVRLSLPLVLSQRANAL